MSNQTVVDSLSVHPSGVVEVRLRKYNDDGSWIYHRTVVPPGVDARAHMRLVNADILQRNAGAASSRATEDGKIYFDSTEVHEPLSSAEIDKVVVACAKAHTPEVKDRYMASLKR